MLLVITLGLMTGPSSAQLQTGNLYGTVTDNQGQSLPGATVTITGNGPPQVQVTNAQGQFRFLGLTPGGYQLTAALDGFSTVEYPNIDVKVGRDTTVEVTLTPAVEEVITVTSESPLLDERKISTGTEVTQTELDKIPTSREPWVVVQRLPGASVASMGLVGSEGNTTHLASGGILNPQGRIQDGELFVSWNEVTSGATSIDVWVGRKSLDSFPNPGFDSFFNLNGNVFGGNPVVFDNGHVGFQDLTKHQLQFWELNGNDPPLFLENVPAGGAINSWVTGGHAFTGVSMGDDYMVFQALGQPPPATGPPGCTPFIGESRFKVQLVGGFNPASVQDTEIILSQPGPFGRGCFDHYQRTDSVDLGNILPTNDPGFDFESITPRLGVTYALGKDRKTLLRASYSRFADQLGTGGTILSPTGAAAYNYFYFGGASDDPSFENLFDIKLDAVSDPLSGNVYLAIPGGIVEDSPDRNVLDLPPDLTFTAPYPLAHEGVWASSLSIKGDSIHQLGNFPRGLFRSRDSTELDATGTVTPRPGILRLPGCADNDRTFCGLGNRFSVKVDWRASDGSTGKGHARALTGDSGSFWFFNRENRELLVKTLDGCGINGHRWFFASGLTDLEVDFSVQDTLTHQGRFYSSPGGPFVPILETNAFPCTTQEIATARADPIASARRTGIEIVDPARQRQLARKREASGAACGGDSSSVCLNRSRFRLDVTWSQPGGASGPGVGGRLEDETGVFWFFTNNNFELVGKVLDACAINNRFWFFAGGLTNVGVKIDLTDTKTGAAKRYEHKAGPPFATITDTAGFPCS